MVRIPTPMTTSPAAAGDGSPDCRAHDQHANNPFAAEVLAKPLEKATSMTQAKHCGFSRLRRRAPIVNAERARPERDDLEESASHHHILEKVDHLVLIGKVAVK